MTIRVFTRATVDRRTELGKVDRHRDPRTLEDIEMPGKFEMFKDKAGEFRFRLKAGNGQIILASEGYKAKASCVNGIDSVKTNAPDDDRYERKEAKNGQFMFNLKSTNGQVIGTSEQYTTKAARENGIESVKKNAPDADTDDQTD
jgi:uncharacterized protein YegP (UPF0339 family)